MENEELPEKVRGKRSDGQTWEEAYELPQEAGGYIWRRVTSPAERAAVRPARPVGRCESSWLGNW